MYKTSFNRDTRITSIERCLIQEAFDSLLEDCGKYAKVANLSMKKMKNVEEEHKPKTCSQKIVYKRIES